jgi:hypothetical protein
MRKPFERRGAGSLATSIALHIGVAAALVQLVFHYPLGRLAGITRLDQERIQYVRVPGQTENSGGSGATRSKNLLAPIHAPPPTANRVAMVVSGEQRLGQASDGSGSGMGVSGSATATGVVPRPPDQRIALETDRRPPVPPNADAVNRELRAEIGIYNDSSAAVAKTRDWTITDKKGRRWGWDSLGVYFGKTGVKIQRIPSFPVEARSAAIIRRDIVDNAWRAVSDAEFRAAVKRIRERSDRERQQQRWPSLPESNLEPVLLHPVAARR